MTGYGYVRWSKCPFCETDIDRNLIAHSVNDCEALPERE